MKRFAIILTVICFVFVGCTASANNQNQETEGNIASVEYGISTSIYGEENAEIKVKYPRLTGDSQNLETLNTLIEQELKQQLEILAVNDFNNLNLQLDFNTSFNNNDYVCFLFEGLLYREGAAHPINVGFSICASLKETKLVSTKSFFTIDKKFVDSFLSQIKEQPADSKFSESEWNQITDYIEHYSNSDMLQILQSEECVFALEKDGVVVLFPVPHAIGDYLKISIPYSWETTVSSN